MKVLTPLDFDVMTLLSSTIAEDDYAEWDISTTYDKGDFAISTGTHTVYRSLTDSNLGNDPDLEQAALADPLIEDPSPVNWQVISATNRWKMFDKKPSVQAVADTSIEVVVQPNRFIGGVAGFGIDAKEVTVAVERDSTEIFSETIAMQDETVVIDWSSYFFQPITPLTEFVVSDIPQFADIDVRVTISRDSGDVRAGQIVMGPIRQIGETTIGDRRTGFSGFDFSLVEQDEFGDLTTVRRAATRLSQFELFFENNQLLGFDSLMRTLRGGVAAVWIGDPDVRKAAINYGFYRDYRTIYETREYSLVSLQIQGIV